MIKREPTNFDDIVLSGHKKFNKSLKIYLVDDIVIFRIRYL